MKKLHWTDSEFDGTYFVSFLDHKGLRVVLRGAGDDMAPKQTKETAEPAARNFTVHAYGEKKPLKESD